MNSVNADEGLELMHQYKTAYRAEQVIIQEATGLENNGFSTAGDTMVLFAAARFVRAQKLRATRYTLASGYTDSFVFRQWNKPWNADHFGPVRVPEGAYFVLGDNRHNAMDSRFIGFVRADEVLGTVVTKF